MSEICPSPPEQPWLLPAPTHGGCPDKSGRGGKNRALTSLSIVDEEWSTMPHVEGDGKCSALSGKRVVVTRAPHQAEELVSLLRDYGARPIFYPCIDIAPPEDTTALDAALRDVAAFDWLILTSANTVRALATHLEALGLPLSMLGHLRAVAVGPATAERRAPTIRIFWGSRSRPECRRRGMARLAPARQSTLSGRF
jgi:hypothetical protein